MIENYVALMKESCQNIADKTAIQNGIYSISYSELYCAVDVFAKTLADRGVTKHSLVALLCNDSIDYVIVSLAVLSLNGVIVPIPTTSSQKDIDDLLEQIHIDFLLTDSTIHPIEGDSITTSSNTENIPFQLRRFSHTKTLSPEINDLNPAFIRFSSGTTGKSKGVILSHQSIYERTEGADAVLNITPDDTIIWVLSMSHHFVVTILLFLRKGATLSICSNNFPMDLKNEMEKGDATFLYASPFHYIMMTNSDMFQKSQFKNVRVAISTAMKLQNSDAEAFYQKFKLHLSEAYGIIEIGLPFINYPFTKTAEGSVGKISAHYGIKINNPDKERIGEILIKGDGMFDAYFSPFKTRNEICKNGWFDTGDVGYLDNDGYLFIVGRKKNLINFSGMKIFPYEVEEIISSNNHVSECVVLGEPHAQYGEIPVAKVVLNSPETPEIKQEIRRFCYKNLPSYKVPKRFDYVDELPKTASGKIKRI